MIDLDDMLAPAPTTNTASQQQVTDDLFGNSGAMPGGDAEPEQDWASAGMFDAAPASLPLDFAVPEMKDAVAPT